MKTSKEFELLHRWFALKKWKALPFQLESWKHFAEGKSGLISVPTGAGKTYAAYLPALDRLHNHPQKGLSILYISPLRALAKDMEIALSKPIEDLGLPYRVERRTGDTSYSKREKIRKNPPEILLTTPESLAVMLSMQDSHKQFENLQTIIVDEWHELLGTKRGVLLELCMSRLKQWSPKVQIWGLTATIGNIDEAAKVCVGNDRAPTIIKAEIPREVIIDSILPENLEKLAWAGQLGMRMLPTVLENLDPVHSTLIFTNTRSQAERWHRAIIEAKPEWEAITALHHSSVDRKLRDKIEDGLKQGTIRFVVCTSSLDLGIDLPEVEKVIQIGSPKSVARLIQRAGRSSHVPMTPCRIAIVPTHAIEIAELKGYRMAIQHHMIESRVPLKNCYDVLIQHLLTCSIGGFDKENLFQEIKTTAAFKDLSWEEFERCIEFLMTGGPALTAYPEYKRLVLKEGKYVLEDLTMIRRHRMNIGTITSDPHVLVKMLRGKTLGTVEEAFIAQMQPGEEFLFGGKRLKLVKYHDLTAFVRLSKGENTHAAVWHGSRLPFSAPLGLILRKALSEDSGGGPEDSFLKDIHHLQNRISHVPKEDELLIEVLKSREGWHLFIYPFEGKTLHQGLAMLIAHRLSKEGSRTFTLSSNDYGLEILSGKPFNELKLVNQLFSPENAEEEIFEITNLHETGKGFFRDIARIAGLVFQGYPSKHKSNRQMQISTGLLFDVLEQYDPENLLIAQAKRESLENQLERGRMLTTLNRLYNSNLFIKQIFRFSPFALPLYIERVSGRISTETLSERIENIKESWMK